MFAGMPPWASEPTLIQALNMLHSTHTPSAGPYTPNPHPLRNTRVTTAQRTALRAKSKASRKASRNHRRSK